MRGLLASFALGALLLSGCAALEPEPCTPDWVEWKTDRITDGFVREYRPELRELATFSQGLENPSPLLLIQMTARLSDFQVMAEAFRDDIVPELKSAIDQCGSPTGFATAFTSILEEQGVSETVLDWVEEKAIMLEQRGTR